MTEELMDLLSAVQERYQIEDQDMEVLVNAIATTIDEAAQGVADQANAIGDEMAAQAAAEEQY